MRWKDRRKSDNVNDTRRASSPKMAVGGGIHVIIVAVIALVVNKDPSALIDFLQQGGSVCGSGSQTTEQRPLDPAEKSSPTSPRPCSPTPRTSGTNSSTATASTG